MKHWAMTSAHFRYLLEEVQDYKCEITGLPLMPENVWILPKTPRSHGGKPGPQNVQLVHESIVKLARDYTKEEIIVLCKTILQNNNKQL